ncbi:MAG: CDP-diacylglycerol--serine O-phosphatidyltransferase [bacterium]
MTAIRPRRSRRPNMRRAVILFPSGLTLGNLFFGVFAIITASRGDFWRAGIYVLLGGICDALDGRVARATNAGSQFGEELDSLVDAVSFGLAPAMIMYFAVLNRNGWDWIFVFLFTACAVMRLARFNIEQAGTAKTYFQGLPSPAAGITLASYYWFSQSWLYNYGAIGNLPWQELLRFLMAVLAFFMISNVPYPSFPRTGFRSLRALGATLLVLGSIVLLATKRLEFFFPLTLIYLVWGPLRYIFGGLFERRQPTIPYDLSEGEDDDDEEDEEEDFELGTSQVHASRQSGRTVRPPREERPRTPRTREEPVARTPRTDERPTARPDRAEKAERPVRTDAERAARREKREKREPRPERTPRPPRDGAPVLALDAPVPMLVEDAMLGGPAADVIGSIPSGADVDVTPVGAEGAPARKRKRRRRRGERKERGPGEAGSSTDTSDDDADAPNDGGADDSPYGLEPRPAAPPTPFVPPVAPAPPVSSQPPQLPPSPPEPHE